VGGRIIIKWILMEYDMRMWTGFVWLKIGPKCDSCEDGKLPYESIQGGKCLDWLRYC
jgi:hypothetical protein